MCKYGDTVMVRVMVPKDLSHTGRGCWKRARIDRCISGIVKSLQDGGINMRSSCCGHDTGHGEIDLVDGRVLFIEHVEPSAGLTVNGLQAEQADLQARIDADPDVAGACCPECDDQALGKHHTAK